MIVYILTFIGSIIILHGFLTWQLFFIGLGFAWNFATLIIADKLNIYAKSTPGMSKCLQYIRGIKNENDNSRKK